MAIDFTAEHAQELELYFPRLKGTNYVPSSPQDRHYNCHAFAMGEIDRRWDTIRTAGVYWPEGVPLIPTLDAFHQAYATRGYIPCNDGQIEMGFAKVAIYVKNGEVSHTALQLADGRWHSKLGSGIDIVHAIEALEGTGYGHVASFMKKTILTKH